MLRFRGSRAPHSASGVQVLFIAESSLPWGAWFFSLRVNISSGRPIGVWRCQSCWAWLGKGLSPQKGKDYETTSSHHKTRSSHRNTTWNNITNNRTTASRERNMKNKQHADRHNRILLATNALLCSSPFPRLHIERAPKSGAGSPRAGGFHPQLRGRNLFGFCLLCLQFHHRLEHGQETRGCRAVCEVGTFWESKWVEVAS